MVISIREIKNIRKKLGLTQSELANISGVSQSLIAKIESCSLDPAYSNAQKIFNALDSVGKKKEAKAKEIMAPRIISVSPDDLPSDAVKKMKKHEISQMPVIDKGKAVGLISEAILLDAVLNRKKGRISDIMDDSPPVLSKDASISAISDMLRHFPLVMIGHKGNLMGIITKSDLLRKVYNK